MGAKKRRQEGPSWAPPSSGNVGTPGQVPGNGGSSEVSSTAQCSSCCNSSFSYTDENNNVIEGKPREELKILERKSDGDPKSSDKDSSLISQAWRKLFGSGSGGGGGGGKRKKTQNSVDLLVLGLLLILGSCEVESVCVWQGGGGFKVACGFRQSGLFRIRSIGGIKGYIGGGFTIGDEDGFKDSLTHTEGQGQGQSGAYVIPNNVHSQRSLPSESNGFVSQYSALQEHPLPIPTGDPAAQHQQKIQYIHNIQHQLDSDHTELQMKAQDQQSQKQLEQQMYIQGGILPPTPTAKVKRAELGGLTKRASLWNWNPFGRGKQNKGGKAAGKKTPQKNGPHAPPQMQNRRGGPPQHHNPKHGKHHVNPNQGGGRWNRRGKNGPPPQNPSHAPGRQKQRGGPPPPLGSRVRGIPFPKSPAELKNIAENFLGNMKNPFSHLQDNFMGKPGGNKNVRKMNLQPQKHSNYPMIQRKEFSMQDLPGPAFPNFVKPLFPPASMESGPRQVPQQSMLPPPPGPPMDIPKFKKLPNQQKAQDRTDDYVEEEEGPPHQPMQGDQHQHSSIDRMMSGVHDDYSQEPPPMPPPHEFFRTGGSPEAPQQFPMSENDPAGLKMLKRTENFGTIFHLVNPDGNPVNMQFEKQPILPPGIHFSPQQQQELAEELANAGFGFPDQSQQQQLPPPNSAGDLDLLGQLDMDSPLATAVYDPNVFPDIYFTTTEKHKNALGMDYPKSHEILDNANLLLGANHLKRILGSSEKASGNAAAVRNEFVKQVVEKSRSVELPTPGEEIIMIPTRRKVRRKKKFRQQLTNQIDTNESDGTDSAATTASPKKRRKGRRKKKYKLATTPKTSMASSTERMGLAMDGGEQSSLESMAKTESSRPEPLTTTPAPMKQELKGTPPPKQKTSFSLPSSEDFMTEPSAENKVDTSGQTTSKTEDSTTNVPFSYSTFGYIDALRQRQGNYDYDFSGPEGPDDFYRGGYDPRFPPDHEINRGHNMTKFIRPRGQGSRSTSTTSPDATNMPFILYDMVGTRNQSRFSSKFHKDVSPFKLDADLEQNDVRRTDPYSDHNDHGNQYHPFYANSNIHNQGDKGVYMKFDSNEWSPQSHSENKKYDSDPFANHYNKTSMNSGYFSQGHSKEYGPSAELPWHRRFDGMGSTTSPPTPVYPGYGSAEVKKFFKNPSSGSVEHGLFGPTMETFGLPKETTKSVIDSAEKRKLHKTLFGGSSADISDLGDWASPNFWANLDTARYSPNADFELQNSDMRRVMEKASQGLKEITSGDLSYPTPIPAPSLNPSQGTVEDLMDDFLAPSHPGGKWGKQRRRKQKPTAVPGTTPTPSHAPSVASTTIITSIPVGSPSSTQAPAKWVAIGSNELEMHELALHELKKGKKKTSGIEIKFKSGEERDPEEEGNVERKDQEFPGVNSNATATNKMGYHESYPGVSVHDFDSPSGYDYADQGKSQQHFPDLHQHLPPSAPHHHESEISYYPILNSESEHGAGVSVHGVKSSEVSRYPPIIQYDMGHQNIPHEHQPPSYSKKEFNPSAEDLGPLPPGKGLPSHQDNPFKQFEKQDLTQNSPGIGFVSAKHEINEMVNQISKFVPDEFLRRDSEEKLKSGSPLPVGMSFRKARFGGLRSLRITRVLGLSKHRTEAYHARLKQKLQMQRRDGSPTDFPKSQGGPPPPPSDMNIPEFGPSGFPNNLRDPESGPPTGPEFHGMKDGNRVPSSGPPPSHPPSGFGGQDAPWDLRPVDNMDANDLGGPHGRPDDRHPPRHRPPHDLDDEMRRHPPPHDRERDRPHMMDGPHRPPLSHIRHPPHRDEHNDPRPPHPHREERPMRPPPQREHERPPPHNRHDFPHPPRGPPGPPPHDRRPPQHKEFDRDFPPRRDDQHPPRHGPPDDRFRDGPRGPPPPPPPQRQDSRPPPNGDKFYPPRKDESHHFDQDRKNFHDNHKIEHLRPPPHAPQFHDRGHEHKVEHSKHGNWRDEKEGNRENPPHHRPQSPPHGHGPPEFKDVQILPHHPDHRPPLPKNPKSHNPFLQPPPPPPPPQGKKLIPPNGYAKIPPQIFKPPPPPPQSPPKSLGNPSVFFANIQGKPSPPHMPPPKSRPQPGPPPPPLPHPPHQPLPPKSRPPPAPLHPPTRKPPVPAHADPMNPDTYAKQPSRDRDLHNSHNNYINSYNDRYEPPPPQHSQDSSHKPSTNHLRPPPPPPMHPHPDQTGGGSRLPYLPFPMPGGGSYETSVIDLDQDPHANFLPHHPAHENLPPAQPTRPVYRPPGKRPIADAKMDEKTKLLDAFETLNKANYDVIQSLAAEKYGPDLIDRVKTKSNMMKPEPKPSFPLKVEPMPVITSTKPPKQPSVQEETAKLAELLKMINKQQPAPQPVAAASTMPQKKPPVDQLSSLLQKLSNTMPTTIPTTPPPPAPTRRVPETPSNPGLLSLTSALNPGPAHDVKSLQAQIAKAIIAKAHQKPHDAPQMPPPPSDTPLQVLQQIAQNRQSVSTSGKNYTASQIETLKKLLALNNIEQKLYHAPQTLPPQPPPTTTEDPLKKLQALLPAAISAAKQKQQLPSNSISRKMLDTSTAHSLAHHHNSNLLQKLNSPDPTLLALKAIALSKAQGVHPQPSISLPQQAKPTEPSSQPIAVDLSAILSPSPPVEEASRRRRLTNVRNAPKSFFPANATQGFEDFTFPLMTEFRCDEQNFFPGLYADTELGCRVFHLCAKTDAGYMMKSFRCPKETVFDQEVLRCNWNLFVDCPKSRNKYHFNKYLSQSFQFLKILGEFSANYQKSDATMTG